MFVDVINSDNILVVIRLPMPCIVLLHVLSPSKRAHASRLRFYFYAVVWVCPEENDWFKDSVTAF